MLYYVFCHQKTAEKQTTFAEIIRISLLFIIFVELFFKPVYPNMVAKKFKFMENYNSRMMYLQVKILTLDIFTHMLPPPPPLLPLLPLQAAMTWNIGLFYICNFFKCDDFTVS